MLKELLKKEEPVVYTALENALKNKTVSSAYLFTGPYGTPKKEAAILLAQSLLCENPDENGMACESCNSCRRVREGTYSDLILIDGKEKPVSKEMVDYVQSVFSKTALEKNGQRIYIILNCETASISAQNSMLKFLEEPGKGITAILTTDNVNAVLPTILSRCTILPFVPLSADAYLDMCKDAGIPEEDQYFASHLARNMDDLDQLFPLDNTRRQPSSIYKSALGMFRQYLDPRERNDLLIDFDISWKSKEKDTKKAKAENIAILRDFFTLLILYWRDVIRNDEQGPAWYHSAVQRASSPKEDYAEMIVIASEERDKVNRFNDLNLLMDQAYYRLEVLRHERGIA